MHLLAIAGVLGCLTLFLYRCRLNLEQTTHDFIVETKKIEIPDHPHAYNGSLVRWQGRMLLSFRESPGPRRISRNYLVWLDKQWSPIGTPYLLPLPAEAEDIRLTTRHERLYLVYTHAGDWMSITEITCHNDQFRIESTIDTGKTSGRMEKNWSPFIANDQLQLIYSIQPHRILNTDGENLTHINHEFHWPWGEMRGGTPAVPLDSSTYLTFFHSQKVMHSRHSKGRSTLHYFMGAYTFTAEKPHTILQTSPEPIVGKGFYRGPKHRQWHRAPVNVVYPCGLVVNEDEIWVSYGRQDREIWIAKLDREKFLASLR